MGLLATDKNYGETCIICEETKYKGIHLYTRFICTDCEKNILQTETNDPKYSLYLKQLKKVISTEIFS